MSGPLTPWQREAPPGASPKLSAPPEQSPPATLEAEARSWLRGNPNWTLIALFLCVIGLTGIAFVLDITKFHGVTASFHVRGVAFPTRVVFAVSVALAAAPFLVTVVQRVPVVYLIPPLVAIFFIYPLFSPYGLPYSRDVVYNFQFAQAILNSGTWTPTVGVTNQAVVYSFFPGGNVFNAEVASLTGLPLLGTFLWADVLFRFLVIPAMVFATCLSLFGARAAALAVILYATIASIEMNVPTQQDFGVVFVGLAVMMLVLLWRAHPTDVPSLRVLLFAFSALVVISHHVSSYVLAILLVSLAILPWVFWRKDAYARLRMPIVATRYVLMVVVYTAVVALPVAYAIYYAGRYNLGALFNPSHHFQVAVGASFPVYQSVWIGLSVALIVALSLLTLFLIYRVRTLALATFGIIAALLTGVLAIPFFSTGLSFLLLRLMEYAGLILCAAAAWWLVNRLAHRGPPRPTATPRPRAQIPWSRRNARGAALAAMAISFVIIAGGSLVPLSTRDQFASSSSVLMDSPLNINQSAYDGALWASDHLDHSELMWGDFFVYTSIGGFGHFQLAYNSSLLFEGYTFNPAVVLPATNTSVSHLRVGQYVVVDVLLEENRTWPAPMFPGAATTQPSVPDNPWNPAYLTKFQNTTYFTLLYQDSLFTIYQVAKVPPAVFTISGTVVSTSTHRPIPGVAVSASGFGTPSVTDTTNSSGGYSLLLPDGVTYSLTASATGYASQTYVVTVPTHNITQNFSLASVYSVAGQVTESPTGAPIAGATVTIFGGASTATDATGGYSFLLTNGTYSVTASDTGHSPQTLNITVAGQPIFQNFSLPLAPPTASQRSQKDVASGGQAPVPAAAGGPVALRIVPPLASDGALPTPQEAHGPSGVCVPPLTNEARGWARITTIRVVLAGLRL